MEIRVDRSLCTGHAQCNAVAPELYELDDDGYCIGGTLSIESESQLAARAGAEACPERAIDLI